MTPFPSFPLKGEGEFKVYMKTVVSSNDPLWQCDALEARLQSADAKREQGRLVESVLASVGDPYGE